MASTDRLSAPIPLFSWECGRISARQPTGLRPLAKRDKRDNMAPSQVFVRGLSGRSLAFVVDTASCRTNDLMDIIEVS